MGFTAAIDAIERPAFLVCRASGIVHGNPIGRALFERNPHVALDIQSAWDESGNVEYRVTPILIADGDHAMAVAEPRAAFEMRVREIARALQLTDRQRNVFAHLVEGLHNKDIGKLIGCSMGTVELHVTAILKKSELSRRHEIIARFYDPEWIRGSLRTW